MWSGQIYHANLEVRVKSDFQGEEAPSRCFQVVTLAGITWVN